MYIVPSKIWLIYVCFLKRWNKYLITIKTFLGELLYEINKSLHLAIYTDTFRSHLLDPLWLLDLVRTYLDQLYLDHVWYMVIF